MSRNNDKLKQGDTLLVAGRIKVVEDGIDISELIDFSLWSAECNVREVGNSTTVFYDLELVIGTGGVFSDEVPSATTATMVAGRTYELDIRVRDEDGRVRSTPTYQFNITKAVSEVPA